MFSRNTKHTELVFEDKMFFRGIFCRIIGVDPNSYSCHNSSKARVIRKMLYSFQNNILYCIILLKRQSMLLCNSIYVSQTIQQWLQRLHTGKHHCGWGGVHANTGEIDHVTSPCPNKNNCTMLLQKQNHHNIHKYSKTRIPHMI